MRYLNLIANGVIVAYFTWQATIPGMQWFDFGGLIAWAVITGLEIQRDFDTSATR